jgi:CubicO group peptidase (beta-lactamase class C family)
MRTALLLLPVVVATSLACASPSARSVSPLATPLAPPVADAPPPARGDVDVAGNWDLRWDRTFAVDTPYLVSGRLEVRRVDGAYAAALALDPESVAPALTLRSLRVDGDHLVVVFDGAPKGGTFEIDARVRDGRLAGEARLGPDGDWAPLGGLHFASTAMRPFTADHSLPSQSRGESGLREGPLRALLEHAQAEESSAIVLVRDGKIAVEEYRDGYDGTPLIAMSGSKSIVSLAIGMLIDEGKLSLDTTMGSLFPEWKAQGAKGTVTVRQLLNHTSGLDPHRATDTPDSIRVHAEKAKLLTPPGARFRYNNAAVDFLAVVAKRAAGIPLDEYLEAHLFRKIDAVGAKWWKDSEGTPYGAGELQIRPVDLAKIGQMLLDGGRWNGEQIVPPKWIEESIAASQPYQADCGLLWWRVGGFGRTLDEPILRWWREVGVDAATIARARALVGKTFADKRAFNEALTKALGADGRAKLLTILDKEDHVPTSRAVATGPSTGFSAHGWLGQYLVVLPKERVVAVRMRRAIYSDYAPGGGDKNGYDGFAKDVAALF